MGKYILYFYIVILPYLFAIQVITGMNYFVPIPGLLITAIFPFYYSARKRNRLVLINKNYYLFSKLVVLFSLIQFMWIASEVLIYFKSYTWLRMIVFYISPVLMLYLIVYMAISSEKGFVKFVNNIQVILIISSCIVAAEILYEWLHCNVFFKGPTEFMLKFYEYVLKREGGDVHGFLWGSGIIRPAGILEHNNTSGAYIGVGALTAFHVRKRFGSFFLLICFLLLIVIVTVGARTAVTATVASIIIYSIFSHESGLKNFKNIILISLFFIILAYFLISQFGYKEIWFSAFDRLYINGLFKLRYKEQLTYFGYAFQLMQKCVDQMSQHPWSIFIGAGGGNIAHEINFVPIVDFYLLELIPRYGLFGFMILFLIVFVFVRTMIFNLKKKTLTYNENRSIVLYSFCIVVLLLITTLHGAALSRKAVFPLLYLAFGQGWGAVSCLKKGSCRIRSSGEFTKKGDLDNN